MSSSYRSPRYHRQALRQLHREFTSRAGDNRHETKRKRLVRPFSQGDVGMLLLAGTFQFYAYHCLPLVSAVTHTAGFTPQHNTGSYEAAAAKLHEQISFDKPWYLLNPEVMVDDSYQHQWCAHSSSKCGGSAGDFQPHLECVCSHFGKLLLCHWTALCNVKHTDLCMTVRWYADLHVAVLPSVSGGIL